MTPLRIAVLGGGNGGHAMAGLLGQAGHSIRLWDRYPEAIEAAQRRARVRLHGPMAQGEVKVDLVTSDLEAAVRGAELLMVVLPAFAHAYLAEALKPHLVPGQTLILNTGSSGSALEVRAILDSAGNGRGVSVAETDTLVYTARLTAPGEVGVYAIKPRVAVASLPASDTQKVMSILGPIYPQFDPVPNILYTSLGNINPLGHLPATLLNVARIERTGGDYLFWREGVTPSVAKLMGLLDQERIAIAQAFDVSIPSFSEWLTRTYGVGGPELDGIHDKILANPAYAEVRGPNSLTHRFVTEDVPMGLVPMRELGALAAVPTPAMDTVIALAGLLNGEDYRVTGRTLQTMGLRGTSRPDLLEYVGR